MDSKVIIFAKPLEHEGVKVESITLVEPLGAQVLDAEKARIGDPGEHSERVRDTVLIAKVAGITEDLVRRIPASQFREAAKFLNGFVETPARGEPNLTPEFVVELDKRIEMNGRIVTALELREPRSGEVEAAQRKLGSSYTTASIRECQFHLVCLITEHPRFIIDRVPIGKLNQASRYLLGFI